MPAELYEAFILDADVCGVIAGGEMAKPGNPAVKAFAEWLEVIIFYSFCKTNTVLSVSITGVIGECNKNTYQKVNYLHI
jgi:hypothetical protein